MEKKKNNKKNWEEEGAKETVNFLSLVHQANFLFALFT